MIQLSSLLSIREMRITGVLFHLLRVYPLSAKDNPNNREPSGSVVERLTRDQGFEPYRLHCVVSFSKNIIPGLVLVQPRKTSPFITERLLMGRDESNQTNKPSQLLV